jgi:hypothetical protein
LNLATAQKIRSSTKEQQPSDVERVNSQHWIREYAFFLWLAEGRPEGREKQHWAMAEAAYRSCMSSEYGEYELTREADRIRELILNHSPNHPPHPDDLALAVLAILPDVEKALEALSQLRKSLESTLDESLIDDSYQALKVWNFELNIQEQTQKIEEAKRIFGCFSQDIAASDSSLAVKSENNLKIFHPDKDYQGVSTMDTDVLQEGIQSFQHDFQEISNTNPGQWVAYRGAERVGFGESKVELLNRCLRQGLRYEELLVRMIQPDIPPATITWSSAADSLVT